MRIFINEANEFVLIESEYMDLLKRESVEYGKTVEELYESEQEFRQYDVTLEIGEEITLLAATERVRNDLESTEDIFNNISYEQILEYKSFSFNLVGENWLTVYFEIIGEIEQGIDIEIKITNIELN